MKNNNFEKQVQETLADLKIQPSEKAWTGIESRIGKKDPSKRILWFLLIGLFLLAGGGYLFLMDGKGNEKEISQLPQQNTEKIIQKSATAQKSSSDPISKIPQIALNEKKQAPVQSKDITNDVQSNLINSTTDSQDKSSKKETIVKYPIEKEKVNQQGETSRSDIKQEEPIKETNALSRYNEISKIKTDPDTDSKTEDAATFAQKESDSSSGNKVLKAETLTHKKDVNPETKKELVLKDSNDLNKVLKVGDNKNASSASIKPWEMGATFSAARVYIGDGVQLGSDLDNINIVFDQDKMYSNELMQPGNSVAQVPIGPASSPENSYGFNAGIVFKKGISPKISFVTGLGYTYYTNSILIGNQLPGDKYSSAGMLSSYRNNVHFVNLPVSAQFHLNTNHKIPLDLSLGVKVSQLLASNAVQYKSGFYEVDNSIFTKTQFGFQAGFSATFFRNLSVGPFYRYGMNPLAKEGLYGKKHLNFLGLKADFIFRKNK